MRSQNAEKRGEVSPAATWKDLVRSALDELGGEGHLSEINDLLANHPKTSTNPTWRDTIRRVVRQYTIFEPVPPNRSGLYRLAASKDAQPPQAAPPEKANHGSIQGMLLRLGRMYGYDTFAPLRDQTSRSFQGQPLKELVTVNDCADVFAGPNVSKIREIDVLWFDEDDYGLYPTYAFEVEHTTKVKSGLDRLLKIPRRYSVGSYIIGPSEKERSLFDNLTSASPFREHSHCFSFRLYAEVTDLFNSSIAYQNLLRSFGVTERFRQGLP